jgi:hypothetical protein
MLITAIGGGMAKSAEGRLNVGTGRGNDVLDGPIFDYEKVGMSFLYRFVEDGVLVGNHDEFYGILPVTERLGSAKLPY